MNSVSNHDLEVILQGLKLEKYLPLLEENYIKYDTFVNLTKDDLKYIGITNEEDLETILKEVEPMKMIFKEINNLKPPNLEAILDHNIEHLRVIQKVLILVRKKLHSKMPGNVLIDSIHPASNTVTQILGKINDELTNLKEDFSTQEEAEVPGSGKASSRAISILALTSLSAIAITSFLTFKYNKVPVLRHWWTLLGKLLIGHNKLPFVGLG